MYFPLIQLSHKTGNVHSNSGHGLLVVVVVVFVFLIVVISMEHVDPLKFGWHKHLYPLKPLLIHVAPFKHGPPFTKHGSAFFN